MAWWWSLSSGPPADGPLLAGRVALVTGAAGAIGRAVAAAFAAAGARCQAADVSPGEGLLACDVTDEDSVAAGIEAARSLGPLTDVVHAAGIVSVGRVEDLTAAELRGVLEVNLVGSFLVARAAARAMTGGGSITLMASQAGLRGGANWSAYSASKAGVIRLAESLAQELAPRGVRRSLGPCLAKAECGAQQHGRENQPHCAMSFLHRLISFGSQYSAKPAPGRIGSFQDRAGRRHKTKPVGGFRA